MTRYQFMTKKIKLDLYLSLFCKFIEKLNIKIQEHAIGKNFSQWSGNGSIYPLKYKANHYDISFLLLRKDISV